jgi:vitamin B12/bleomycin/antimicrobial peptide transport system ATP-binding/permease protein
MERTRLSILREAWRIARPYWFSEERWAARGLLALIITLSVGQTWINVRLNTWTNDFNNTLQQYDEHGFFSQLAIFTGLAFVFIIVAVYQTYLTQMLQIRWRRWMTDVYLHEWLGNQTYYRLQLGSDATDNPDQRISEDLGLFPAQTLGLTLGLLSNVMNAVSFSVILWNLSGVLPIPLGPWGSVVIPGDMFWAVVLYTIVGTWLTIRLGRTLVALN